MNIANAILNFFIPSAYAADTSAAAQQGSSFPMMMILIASFLFIYFTIWRPQTKRAKDQRELMTSLAKDDEVLTAGGILGKIVKISDDYVILAINDTSEITIQKSSISGALPKGSLKTISGSLAKATIKSA